MQHVSRELAERMVKSGWGKETAFVHVLLKVDLYGPQWRLCLKVSVLPKQNGYIYVCIPSGVILNIKDVGTELPAPTLCEVVEEVSYDDFLRYWKENLKPDCQYDSSLGFAMFENAVAFARWHDTTMRSAEACAEVWLKLHEKEGK